MVEMRHFLKKLDHKLSLILGLTENADVVYPTDVSFSNNHLFIIGKEPYKRHRIIHHWLKFNQDSWDRIDKSTKRKLGLAIGSAIAKDLVVSFDQPAIKVTKKKDSI